MNTIDRIHVLSIIKPWEFNSKCTISIINNDNQPLSFIFLWRDVNKLRELKNALHEKSLQLNYEHFYINRVIHRYDHLMCVDALIVPLE